MIQIIRTNSDHIDFIKLVQLLDSYLTITDGEDHAFYDQFNKIDSIKHVILGYENGLPVGCGAIKEYDDKTMEVKRMYTTENCRGKGVASMILAELEKWAIELSFDRCILETGIRQKEAVSLYHKNGYTLMGNYGQYEGVEDSLCFQKDLRFKQLQR